MARGGRIGPPHVTRARNAFNALDMFSQLITFSTIRTIQTAEDRTIQTGFRRSLN